MLRYTVKILYELCLKNFLNLTKPSLLALHGSIAPCPGVHAGTFLIFIWHNSTVSRQLRYSLSRDCVSPTTPTNLTFHHSVARRKHRPPVRTRRPHILPQRKGRKRRGRRAHVLLRERIAKLLSVCRIMLRIAEMHRHGRRGKALCATDGA